MTAFSDKFMCSGAEWAPRGPREEAVAVLMSGGVDSSVTAAVLQANGVDVVGITMQIPSGIGPSGCGAELRACCGTGASQVARRLGIPHYFVDVRDEFRRFVLEPFRDAYRRGLTPSPCIDCNTHVKFACVMELGREFLGIRTVATGHYARAGGSGLYAAADAAKDQSYFLYGIRRTALEHIRFPMGGQTKARTREQAASFGLDVAERDESVELCFADQGDYRLALGPSPDAGPGDVIDLSGKVLGRHKGISHYTIGQREGLGIATGVPLYVADIDAERNTITLGDRAAAASRTVRAHKLNILAPELLEAGGPLLGKIRSRQPAAVCRVIALEGDDLTAEFSEPQHGVTPGQHLVLYSQSGQVVGGGEIRRRSESSPDSVIGC